MKIKVWKNKLFIFFNYFYIFDLLHIIFVNVSNFKYFIKEENLLRKFNKKKLSCFIGLALSVFSLSITSFAATHTYDSADFSVSASLGNWDEYATLETHGYEVKTDEILLNDVAFNGGLDVSDKTLVISGSVNIDTLSTNDPYSSSSSINIKGNGVLTVSNLMAL